MTEKKNKTPDWAPIGKPPWESRTLQGAAFALLATLVSIWGPSIMPEATQAAVLSTITAVGIFWAAYGLRGAATQPNNSGGE
jgi:hypothetical protein